jgi:[acyl-carrier-protein] S-malonyltransferase
MAGAAGELLAGLLAIPQRRGQAGFIANRDGRLVADEAQIPHLLAGQLTHPVAWWETMATLADAGVTHAVIVGPGKALRGFLRGYFRDRVCLLAAEDDHDLPSTIEVLRP